MISFYYIIGSNFVYAIPIFMEYKKIFIKQYEDSRSELSGIVFGILYFSIA